MRALLKQFGSQKEEDKMSGYLNFLKVGDIISHSANNTHIHTHTHIHIYTYTHTLAHIHTHTHM